MKNFEKIILILFFALCSIIGFMVKLPRVFHHYDKFLHALFYFSATLIVALLYPKRLLFSISGLILFGVIIEFAQEYSNKISYRIIGKAIHGRFDFEDVKFNIIGIFLGILFFQIFKFFSRSIR